MLLLQHIHHLVWGPVFLGIVFAAGVYFTLLTRGVAVTRLIQALKMAFRGGEERRPGEMTQFQALMTSLASAIGTGNIAGVATALFVGGYGSIFWMWVIAMLGMALKYAEALAASRYRIRSDSGDMVGGPMYFLAAGANSPRLAIAFAILGLIASFGTGNLVQVNSVADAMRSTLGVDPLWTGVATAALAAFVIWGGLAVLGRLLEVLVPGMALLYLGGGLAIVAMHLDQIPTVFAAIFQGAWGGQAAAGGFAGATVTAAIQAGFSKGIFASEAGLGTSCIASAAAHTDYPARPGLIAMTSVFLSTVVVCTITALVIGVTGVLGTHDPVTGKALNGAALALSAFQGGMPGGAWVVSIGLILFALSTILGWLYYGEKCAEYLGRRSILWTYRIVFVAALIPGAILDLEAVWAFADVANAAMAIPNVIGLFLLRGVIAREHHIFMKVLAKES